MDKGRYVELSFVQPDGNKAVMYYDCVDPNATEPEFMHAGGFGSVNVDNGVISIDGETDGDTWSSSYSFEIKDGKLYMTYKSGNWFFFENEKTDPRPIELLPNRPNPDKM